ncbi:MAG TPA: protein kinase [Kofleriaceae bacterium]|nr:protein kinase [Kofleriaceae bacterium]
MTTRDPRSRELPSEIPAGEGGRELTQSLDVEPGEAESPAELAFGTHNRRHTHVDSPGARRSASAPGALPARAADASGGDDDLLGAVLGSYRLLELLGKGGMGHVYRAEHVKLGREVALKLLRRDYASRRDAVARFFQEARTVNRVRHHNIVDVTDFVELDDGTTYIIMELLTGESLGAWARGVIDLPRALAVLVQICDGLGAAHEVGVVHRDLKPDNVIVVPTPDGAELVKLLDFGVAKLLNRDDEDEVFQTAAGTVIGTPAYMSPEQAGGMEIDARSDIYSLGAIMYELFCGQPAFRGRSFGELVRKHLTETPVPPRQTPGGEAIAPALEAVILRCLDKDPDQRFATTGELRDALLHLLVGAGASAAVTTAAGPDPLAAPNATSTQYAPHTTTTGDALVGDDAPLRSTRWWPWLAAAALAVGLGAGAEVWHAAHDAPDARPVPGAPPSGAPATRARVAAPVIAPAGGPSTTAVSPVPPASPSGTPSAAGSSPTSGAGPTAGSGAVSGAGPTAGSGAVEVRLDSQPSGAVFAAGQPRELCRTPCTVQIDLADGGPTDQRAYVVKRAGYADGEIRIDLTAERRDYHVVLRRDLAPAPRPGAKTADPRGPRLPASHPARPAQPASPVPPISRDDAPTSAPPAPPSNAPIGPADTLDPFRKK